MPLTKSQALEYTGSELSHCLTYCTLCEKAYPSKEELLVEVLFWLGKFDRRKFLELYKAALGEA